MKAALLSILVFFAARSTAEPNVVVILGDDWSWPHAGAYGSKVVPTPTFDRIAKEGALFTHAFADAPSCTPSRHSILTGQHPWRLGDGASLGGSLPAEDLTVPELLRKRDVQIGYARKGVSPSRHVHRGGKDPLGTRYQNFDAFLDQADGKPFFFWYGAGEPHRPYDLGAGLRSEKVQADNIVVPPSLPDNATIRSDLADYHLRVARLDELAGQIIERLEKDSLLDQTLVIMAGDNGMPFPMAKATLRDGGTRVPLAIRLPGRIKGGTTIDDLVTLADLAPTVMAAIGDDGLPRATASSLWPALTRKKGHQPRSEVLLGMERHVYPWPSRALRTHDYLYIRNLAPAAWPTGARLEQERRYDFGDTPWPTEKGAFSHNIDPSPTKQWLRLNDPKHHAFQPRAHEELYDLKTDPDQLTNLAEDPTYTKTREELRQRLHAGLRATEDPRFKEAHHTRLSIHGWQIHLADSLLTTHPEETKKALDLIALQLGAVARVIPKTALAEIRKVPIWINPPYKGFRERAEYHPGAGWLSANGRNPAMEHAVEITNVARFEAENVRMPWLMLHELAHAYHHRVLGHGYDPIKKAYASAKESGKYETVKRWTGRRHVQDRAYAISNPQEYFSEATEAYFGKNDFFPFDRKELEAHDPKMHDVVAAAWGVTPKIQFLENPPTTGSKITRRLAEFSLSKGLVPSSDAFAVGVAPVEPQTALLPQGLAQQVVRSWSTRRGDRGIHHGPLLLESTEPEGFAKDIKSLLRLIEMEHGFVITNSFANSVLGEGHDDPEAAQKAIIETFFSGEVRHLEIHHLKDHPDGVCEGFLLLALRGDEVIAWSCLLD